MAKDIQWGLQYGLPANPMPGQTYKSNVAYWDQSESRWKFYEMIWTRTSESAPYEWMDKDWVTVESKPPIIEKVIKFKNDPLPPMFISSGIVVLLFALIIFKK